MPSSEFIELAPSARRLTESLRDIGYDFPAAVADLVDNSIAAGATRIDIDLRFAGRGSWVRIADNGTGMSPTTLDEAMRFGTRRDYGAGDLGRFGLGLKTASLSQCRVLTVATRTAQVRRRIHMRVLDLDLISAADCWAVRAPRWQRTDASLWDPIAERSGTVVTWRKLDRVLDYRNPNGAWAQRRLARLARDLAIHLGMVFHRFIDGEISGRDPLEIRVNGECVAGWDPFARSEPATAVLPQRAITIDPGGTDVTEVRFLPYVLPHRSAFSAPEEFERLSGPSKWNRQQGFYVYRAGRLIQSGGWSGIRAIDEHTKFARAAIEFDPVLDEFFAVNVAKMRITLPPAVRTALEQDVASLCREASGRYRRGELATRTERKAAGQKGSADLRGAGIAVVAAALEAGEFEALTRIASTLYRRVPEVAAALGLPSANGSPTSEHAGLKTAI